MRFDLKTSFASLKARKVAEACDGYLEARKRRIDAKREALIDAEMKRRLFRPKTRDAARRRLIDEGVFGEYLMAGESGAWWADKVEDLRVLAIAAGDGDVFVSSEDAGVIANFLTPNAKVTGAAPPYGAASSDRRERGRPEG